MLSIILKSEYRFDYFEYNYVYLCFPYICIFSAVPQELTGLFVEKPESVTAIAGINTQTHIS